MSQRGKQMLNQRKINLARLKNCPNRVKIQDENSYELSSK